MTERVVIERRFNGPPTSAHGGYACGLLAERLGGVVLGGGVEVTLHAPPPLERPLEVVELDGALVLRDAETALATARRAVLDLEVPARPTAAEAAAMSEHCWGLEEHAFETCFGCGPSREPGDGLRIFAGRRPGDAVAAAPWTPHESLADAAGRIPARIVWAAIDCPGYFGVASRGEAALLGRMTGEVHAVPDVGEPCVVIGWGLGTEGRKRFAGAALLGADGRVVARARQVWVRTIVAHRQGF